MNYDNISYFLAQLNLALKQKRFEVCVPNTKLIYQSLLILVSLGYVNTFYFIDSKQIKVFLKYNEYGEACIRGLRRVSRPGVRVYFSYKQLCISSARLNNLNNVYQNVVISTSRGLLLHNQAIKERVGGEIIFIVN